MGLLGKIKNVLFEEEEIEIPVFKKEEKEVKKEKTIEKPKPVETKPKEEIRKEIPKVSKVEVEEDNERETFKAEPTFQFPVFDEKDFKEPVKTRSNRNEEKPKNNKKKIDFGRFDIEEKPKEEKKKFVPSPVISPVFGVLDKNYVKKDHSVKKEETKNKVISVDDVRNKAYGSLEDQIEQTINTPVEEFYEEPSKTIDELITETTTETPVIDNSNKNDYKEDEEVKEESLAVLDEIEEDINKTNLEDTLESDLFNLIDSMYTSKEEEK